MVTKKCLKCGKEFIPHPTKQKQQKYCSKFCQRKNTAEKQRGTSFYGIYNIKKIPTGTVGTIAELMVSVDLMKKGYEVFRALSPSCSCDILILKNNKVIKIEVRTGYEGEKTFSYPKNNIKAEQVAVVLHRSNKIIYIPPL